MLRFPACVSLIEIWAENSPRCLVVGVVHLGDFVICYPMYRVRTGVAVAATPSFPLVIAIRSSSISVRAKLLFRYIFARCQALQVQVCHLFRRCLAIRCFRVLWVCMRRFFCIKCVLRLFRLRKVAVKHGKASRPLLVHRCFFSYVPLYFLFPNHWLQ